MGKIHVLDKRTAELIAAGEVIDRPAAVVKELVENALDAGAARIAVEIQRGGVVYMRVTDDGCGIAPEEVRDAFLRHATSKLRAPEDLQSILTMGFRGEALASIAAMCRVEVLTRVPGAACGVRLRIEGGEEQEFAEAGCPEGTTFIVRDIFYNTPARMKFLKKDAAEAAAIGGVLDRLAVIHPLVSFCFIRDGRTLMRTPGNSRMSDALYSVWGRGFYRSLTEVRQEACGVRVRGYVSKPAEGRASRSMQHFYVNGRCVRSRACCAALEEAYRTRMMKGRFPACALDVRVPPAVCDVNVHPAKLEVRFADEKAVYSAVYYAVLAALDGLDGRGEDARLPVPAPAAPPAPAARDNKGRALQTVLRDSAALAGDVLLVEPAAARGFKRLAAARPGAGEADGAGAGARRLLPPPAPRAAGSPERGDDEAAPQGEAAPARRYDGARLIGELSATYLLLECDGSLILIDKHAAHERLQYERIREGRDMSRQALLEPVAVTLQKEEYTALLAGAELVRRLGFDVADFGEGTVLVREIPTPLGIGDAARSVMDIAAALAGGGEPTVEAAEELYHSIACKSAVRAHDAADRLELEALVALLNEHGDVRFCPHGRPIAAVVSRQQIEKMFGRA